MQKSKILYLLSFLVLIILDQLSKYIVRSSGGFYICNANLAFGLKVPPAVFYVLWIIIILSLITFIAKSNLKIVTSPPAGEAGILDKNSSISLITNYKLLITKEFSLLLIFSGAISNIIDRLFFGCVIDFIDLKFWPVFNLADIYITIGVVISIIRTTDFHMKSHDSTEF
ncbi:MAG: Lipoprotein signal peptidase [Candidatus Moranbacteria bacterium GW2011_GWF2_35_39]|nr:MAG: Lipoprotein signal peptidase [Candidatus Moranbacteria bacterium GW2011_GWF2_35_39]